MPVARFDPEQPAAVHSHHSILRRVRCVGGRVTARLVFEPRGEYGVVTPRFTGTSPATCSVIGGPDALWLRATRPVGGDGDRVVADWDLESGQEEWIEVGWTPAAGDDPFTDRDLRAGMAARFADTVAFWEDWFSHGCLYDGEHHRKVHRSALVLKALTYAPTGAVIAAGTTSLPEWIGGERNWDYRFTWIRDATLTLSSLAVLGTLGEAAAFKGWLERTGAGRPEDLQIMYRVTGERLLPEVEARPPGRPPGFGTGAGRQRSRRSAPARFLRSALRGRLPVRPGRGRAHRIQRSVPVPRSRRDRRVVAATRPRHLGDPRPAPPLRPLQAELLGRTGPGLPHGRRRPADRAGRHLGPRSRPPGRLAAHPGIARRVVRPSRRAAHRRRRRAAGPGPRLPPGRPSDGDPHGRGRVPRSGRTGRCCTATSTPTASRARKAPSCSARSGCSTVSSTPVASTRPTS